MNILIDIKFLYEKDCGIKTYLHSLLKELLIISKSGIAGTADINNININNIKNINNIDDLNNINIDVVGLTGKISRLTDEHLIIKRLNKNKKLFNSFKRIIPEGFFLYQILKKIYRTGKKQVNYIDAFYGSKLKTYDIFWTPYQMEISSSIAKRKFISIYDIYPLTNPDNCVKEHVANFKNYMDNYLGVFDGVITCSEFVKNDFANYFNYQKEKIYIVKGGIDRNIFKKINDKSILKDFRNKYNLINPFILYVGAIHPRKNILNLLEAFKELKISNKTGKNLKNYLDNKLINKLINKLDLVLVSNTSWLSGEVLKLLDELKENIKIFKQINNEELVLFYNTAEAFVFPSFYEGFGIPPLEAFACGIPVIASNTTAIPEVCGDAAYYFDPFSIDDIKNAMFNVISSQKLKNDLITKGLERTESFSWRQSAIDLLNAFGNELNL